MKYGLPYQGSKSKLAEKIIAILPPAEHLYDVFAGGCAISHAAILSNKFGCVHFSDISDSVQLFKDALAGNVPDGSKWISREEFQRLKDSDPYVRIIWSFGNNQRDYLYSKEIEPYKKCLHEMIYGATPNERRLKFRELCKLMPIPPPAEPSVNRSCKPSQFNHHPEWTYRLESSERQLLQRERERERVFRLQSTERHNQCCECAAESPFCGGEYEMKIADYRNIDILPFSVVYADPPYKNTKGYGEDQKFDHEAFYEWVRSQECLVFVSEYEMPDDFVSIMSTERVSTFSATNNKLRKIEQVFIHKSKLDEYRRMMKQALPTPPNKAIIQ